MPLGSARLRCFQDVLSKTPEDSRPPIALFYSRCHGVVTVTVDFQDGNWKTDLPPGKTQPLLVSPRGRSRLPIAFLDVFGGCQHLLDTLLLEQHARVFLKSLGGTTPHDQGVHSYGRLIFHSLYILVLLFCLFVHLKVAAAMTTTATFAHICSHRGASWMCTKESHWRH